MDALITAAQQPAAARQSASGCGVTRESDAAAAAVAALDSTKRLLEYALLLGLSRSEAVAYLQRTAGLQPALTELGASAARAGTPPRWLTAPPPRVARAPQCGTNWPRRTRSTSRSTRSAWPSGCAAALQGPKASATQYLTRPRVPTLRPRAQNECCTGSQGSGCAFCCRLVAAFLAAPLPAPRAEDDTAASFCPDQASQPAACGLGGYHASHTVRARP